MIATHYQIDSEHYLADYMATRGSASWAGTPGTGGSSSFLLDHALVDIGVGVLLAWCRAWKPLYCSAIRWRLADGGLPGAGGRPHVTPLEGMRPAAGLNDLPPADGLITSAAHPGRPDVLTAWMDASVVDENDALATDPELDLFDECNGPPTRRTSSPATARPRSPATTPSPTGRDRTQACPRRGFSDRPFTVLRTWADPRMVDPTLEPTKRPPTCATGVPVKANRSAHGIAAACTLRSWLGMWSLRHAQTRAEPHLARITARPGDQRRTGHRRVPVRRPHLRRTGQHRQVAVLHRHRPLLHHPEARSEKADTIAKWIAKRWR